LKDRQVHVLAEDGYSPVWAPTGHALYHQGDAIMAVPLDPQTFRASGSPSLVHDGIGTRISYQTRLFAVARDGTLVHATKSSGGEAGWGLISVDRKGQETRLASFERQGDSPRLSPDGTRVAFRTPAPLCDVWVHELERGTTMRLTNEGDNHGVVWTRDATRIVVSRVEREGTQILSLAADGSGGVKKLATFPVDSGAVPVSSAGDIILVQHRFGTNSGTDIVSIPVSGGSPTKVLAGPFDEAGAALSPDGRLVAYVSNESGRNEVYLRPLATQGGRLSISTAGGTEPAWSPDGRELFYRNGREVLSVTFTNDKPSRPQLLFSRQNVLGPLGGPVTNYDAARGGRTLISITGEQWTEGELGVVLNWFSGWKRLGGGGQQRSH
jgi:serine/threonine-protein kinase